MHIPRPPPKVKNFTSACATAWTWRLFCRPHQGTACNYKGLYSNTSINTQGVALQKRKQITLQCSGTAEWKGLTSKAVCLRAWVTHADSWGMHAAAQPGCAPQIQKAASALSLGALGCPLLSLSLTASDEPHNTHITLLQQPQLFSPHLNCTWPLAHPAWLSTSLVTKADVRSVCFFFLSKLLTLGQQLAALFTTSQCEGQEWGRFAFQESHFFPMKSMHNPNTQCMLSTTDKSFPWYVVCINTLFLPLPVQLLPSTAT